MKKFLVCFAVLFLSGCANYVPLDSKIMAQTVAIDFEEGQYTLAAKHYTGSGPSYKGDDGGNSEQVMLKASGPSLLHALKEVEYNFGKSLMFGEFKTIVLGTGVIEGEILEVLKVLSLVYESYPHMIVVGAKEKAQDILTVKYKGEPPDTGKLHQIIDAAFRVGVCPPSRIETLTEAIEKVNTGFFLPLIECRDTGTDMTDDGREVFVNGGVIIMDGKPVGSCDNYISGGLFLFANYGEYATVTIENEGRKTPVTLQNMKINTQPALINGRLNFNVHFKAQAKYLETGIDQDTLAKAHSIEEKLNGEIKTRLNDAAREIIVQHAADFVGLENIIRHKDFRLWTKIEDEYDDYLRNAHFIITAETKINNYGI
ncbi:MAG: hypothetical protein FWH05_04925 [Oscillospiraceae bacterium]|nr:hypothetical protein [Oscillospiraceae bacterium]